MLKALGRELPEHVDAYGRVISFAEALAARPNTRRYAPPVEKVRPRAFERAMSSAIACGDSDLHHSYITHGAITCNGRQTREENPAYLSGYCKCGQSLETPRISLVLR